MKICALASDDRARRYREAFPEIAIDAVAIERAHSLSRSVRKLPIDGVLVEVAALGDRDLPMLRELERYASVPLVLDGMPGFRLARAAVHVQQWGHPKLFLTAVAGNSTLVRTFLRSCSPAVVRERLIQELVELQHLPCRVHSAVHQLWEGEPRALAIKTLAARSGYSPRWIYQSLTCAGLAQPRLLLTAVRVIDAWAYSRDPGFSDADCAHKSGSASWRRVRRLVQAFGLPSDRVTLGAVDAETLLGHIVRRLRSQPAARIDLTSSDYGIRSSENDATVFLGSGEASSQDARVD